MAKDAARHSLRLPAAQGGREPGSCGMANPGEASQPSSYEAKRKLLNRLGQNGKWPGLGGSELPQRR